MGIRVRATKVCYCNHKRWKEGAIFEIQNMGAFSKLSMELVDKAAQPEVKEPDNVRKPAAISEGSGAALHQGNVVSPKKAGEEADKAAAASAASEETPETPEVPQEGETTGDEDVI